MYRNVVKIVFIVVVLVHIPPGGAEKEDIEDFEFSFGSGIRDAAKLSRIEPDVQEDAHVHEDLIAQESRQYQTVVKPPILIVKPNGITNSHRPQYNLDSFEEALSDKRAKSEEEDDESEEETTSTTQKSIKEYRPSHKFRMKEVMIREAVLRALERKDHIRKFAQILPIIRAMSGSQRIALASLVASQVTTPPGRKGLDLEQVRSMFGNDANATSDLMLPILLDMANLFRRAARSGKEPREVLQLDPHPQPQAQLLRRSFTPDEGDVMYDDDEDIGVEEQPEESTTTTAKPTTTTVQNNRAHARMRNMNRNTRQQNRTKNTDTTTTKQSTTLAEEVQHRSQSDNLLTTTANISAILSSDTPTSEAPVTVVYAQAQAQVQNTSSSRKIDNRTFDQSAAASNNTLTEELPVAEKLRSWFNDRKLVSGKPARRPTWPPPGKGNPPAQASASAPTRRANGETHPSVSSLSGARRRLPSHPSHPSQSRKLQTTIRPLDLANCELFTNSLCLEAENYPTEAILLSIRRNKAAAGALLADYKQQVEEAVDGVSAAQEAKYTPEHYLNTNRRGDSSGSVRDFAGAGEAGFMCPSTVKYARPQRARATSGNWKYIVNTGEHTQTLRLEKCLKPKESCTYLTDNFKSKCVQVYNYHRLLTWDQQNGLHMDIFKVPTCCSCHIEGYSVSFPPLGQRTHETSSEQFPGQDLSAENHNPFEVGQSTIVRPSITKTTSPFALNKPIDAFSVFGDTQNLIPGVAYNNPKFSDGDDLSSFNGAGTGPMDSYGNSYFPDNFKQASSIRNVKKQPNRNQIIGNSFESSVTLPSYLEPPSQSAVPISGQYFGKSPDSPSSKFKHPGSQHKRVKRPSRRPIRKNASGADDLMSSGSSPVETQTALSLDTLEDLNEEYDEFLVQPHANRVMQESISPVSSTTEVFRQSTTSKPPERGTVILKDITLNKRVNYNYHPIIDFFESGSKTEEVGASDREDSVSAFVPPNDSEWKPMNQPPTRSNQVPKSQYRLK